MKLRALCWTISIANRGWDDYGTAQTLRDALIARLGRQVRATREIDANGVPTSVTWTGSPHRSRT